MPKLRINVTCEHESGEGLHQVEFDADDIFTDEEWNLVAELGGEIVRDFPRHTWTAFSAQRTSEDD